MDDVAKLTARLNTFYAAHNPEKLSSTASIAKKYVDKQDELCARLERKYGAGSFDLATPKPPPVVN